MNNHRLQHTRLDFDLYHTYQRLNEKKRKRQQVKANVLACCLLVACYTGILFFI